MLKISDKYKYIVKNFIHHNKITVETYSEKYTKSFQKQWKNNAYKYTIKHRSSVNKNFLNINLSIRPVLKIISLKAS